VSANCEVVESTFRFAPFFLEDEPEKDGNLVRLADDARKCVVYLGWPDPAKPGEISPEGTGFLVGLSNKDYYLVTAAHVANKLDGPFGIRLNERGSGQGRIHHIDEVTWFKHPTDEKTVDVAITPFQVPEWADANVWPFKNFLSKQKEEEKDIGAGDLIYVVGVFYLVHGRKRNLPAVHVGHVLLMPDDEPIPVKDWNDPAYPKTTQTVDVRGYLVEAGALPGSSGSPVFVRRSLHRKIPDGPGRPLVGGKYAVPTLGAWLHGTAWLMGLWHSAWFGEPAEVIAGPPGSKVPAGMGIVVPAERIIEVINRPDLTKMRDKKGSVD
jgi:hypothetical protein